MAEQQTFNQTVSDIFNSDAVAYYRDHKNEITSELLEKLRSYGNEGRQIALDILDTTRSKDGYYFDARGEKISFDGDRGLKKPFTPMALSNIHIEELKKCAGSLDYFRENYVKIRTKDGVNFPEMRPYQKGFLDAIMSDYETIVSTQPRQSGKSVTTAIFLTWEFVFNHDKNIGICADKTSLAKEFLNNVKNIFYNLPMWMKIGITTWNKSDIGSENEMRILTSSPAGAFRGFTIDILVSDETAFINSTVFYKFIDAIAPAQSAKAWKKSIFISTPNGLNHFYDMVDGAKRRKEYKLVDEKEKQYLIEKYGDKILSIESNSDFTYNIKIDEPSNGMLYYGVDWRDVPRFNIKGERITPDEFRESVIDKYGLVYFNQNYACQFIGSSYTLVDSETLKNLKCRDPIMKWDNRLNIYDEPKGNHNYIMGVDPAKGGLDAFAVQIIDVSSFPFIQVASAQTFKENYQIMPKYIFEWACQYNNAYIIIENNEGAGTFIAAMLYKEYEYENLFFQKASGLPKTVREPGFRTTTKTRTQILETFKHFLDNKRLVLSDRVTIGELFTFIIKDNKYQADEGCHDDMIMSLCLCFAPFIDTRNFDDMKDLIEKLYSDDSMDDVKLSDYIIIGDFDDASDVNESIAGQKYDSEFEYSTDYYSREF